jgi:hypothetical protein
MADDKRVPALLTINSDAATPKSPSKCLDFRPESELRKGYAIHCVIAVTSSSCIVLLGAISFPCPMSANQTVRPSFISK